MEDDYLLTALLEKKGWEITWLQDDSPGSPFTLPRVPMALLPCPLQQAPQQHQPL